MTKELYVDKVPLGKSFGVNSMYLPLGIMIMDARFCNRILAFKKGESYNELNWRGEVDWVWQDTKEEIERDIERNPHLHPAIKENLLFNLNMGE